MSFNSTSNVLPYTAADNTYGVILPHSSQVLSKSDIDSRIKQIKDHIDYLSSSQSHRKTHGGKGFRARQISLRNQIDTLSKKLALLKSAKDIIKSLSITRLVNTLKLSPTSANEKYVTKKFHKIRLLVNTLGIRKAKAYVEYVIDHSLDRIYNILETRQEKPNLEESRPSFYSVYFGVSTSGKLHDYIKFRRQHKFFSPGDSLPE